MKRLTFTLALLLCLANLQAQESPWQDNPNSISISGGTVSGFFLMKSLFSWIPAAVGHSKNSQYYGNYGIQYYYQVAKWCRVGARGTWEGDDFDFYTSKEETAPRKGITLNHIVSFVASAQFLYINREQVQLYSGLDCGPAVYITDTRYDEGYSDTNGNKHPVDVTWLPAINITPIGIAFGSWRVYGYIETNIGYEAIAKAGLGVHF